MEREIEGCYKLNENGELIYFVDGHKRNEATGEEDVGGQVIEWNFDNKKLFY